MRRKPGSPMPNATNLVAHGETPNDFLQRQWSPWHVAAVSADWMRENKQKVYLDSDNQEPDDRHPSHAAVDGMKDAKTRRKLAEEYEWIVAPINRHEPPKED
jgi:hypothetical protein